MKPTVVLPSPFSAVYLLNLRNLTLFSTHPCSEQLVCVCQPPPCVRSFQEAPGAGTIFVDVLWAMVVLVGCSMSLGGCMVAYRHFKAGGGGAPMYLPVQAAVSLVGLCLFFFFIINEIVVVHRR